MRFIEFRELLEYDRSKTITALGNGILKAAGRDAFLKSKNLDDQQTISTVVDAAEKADPTPNKQNVPWIVRQFTKKGMKYEDLYKLENYLKTFTSTKGQHKRLGINSDINQYDWRTLSDVAHKLSNTDVADLETADATKVEGAKILYDGPLGTLSIPETEAASCELGRGTEWCTAATKSDNKFAYYSEQGPIYMWHDKKRKTKYQLHFETGEIMNHRDKPVTKQEARYLATENPITSKLIKRNASITVDVYKEYLEYFSDIPDDYYDTRDEYNDEPSDEILHANLEVVLTGLDDNRFASLINVALTDSSPDVDDNNLKIAWLNELTDRPQLHKKLASARPFKLPIQYAQVTNKRSPAMEKSLLSANHNSRALVKYAQEIIGGKWPEAEPIIAKDPVDGFLYATLVIKKRFPAAEPLLRQSKGSWNRYKAILGLTDENR